jgi:seryl-tRNA synthetase
VGRKSTKTNFCTECGQNRTHNTEKCFKLQNRASRDKSHSGHKSEQKPKPFSKRTFRKEVNAIARKAAKKGTLDLYAAALAREQNKLEKQAKKKTVKKTVAANADSDSSSDESMNNLEEKIPKKKAFRGKLLKRPPNILDRNVKMSFSEKEIRESLKYLQKQRKAAEILIPDSEEEEDEVNASDEERAFLMSIDQEEQLKRTVEMETNSSTESNN